MEDTSLKQPNNPTNPAIPPENPQAHKLNKMWISAIVVCICVGILLIISFLLRPGVNVVVEPLKNTVAGTLPNVSPTPFEFQEITIPYLRTKTFKSELGPLESAYQGNNFTAYLTSYTSDGFKINGLLTKPTGQQPAGGWPAIVFVHGYIPPTQYQTNGEAYSAYVNYLASQGFVVFKIDLRGHGTSEGEPGGGYFGADYIADTLHAYSALQQSGFVNPKKIGVWGHSMAGNVLLRTMVVKTDIPAAVIWAGAVYSYVDREKYGINDNSFQPNQTGTQSRNRRQRLVDLYGQASTGSAFFWKQMAPTNYLQDIKGAIQLDHAVDDDVVNVAYSRDLNALLDKTSVSHEIHEYPSGGHNISGASFTAAMENTANFFKKYLQ